MEVVQRQIIPSTIFSVGKISNALKTVEEKKSTKETELPWFTRAQVLANAGNNWLIIDGLVLDVTDFLGVHPGGYEVLLEFVGLDATSAFNDVGHGSMARSLMHRYAIGRIIEQNSNNNQKPGSHPDENQDLE